MLASWGNRLLERQNELAAQQNELAAQQNELVDRQNELLVQQNEWIRAEAEQLERQNELLIFDRMQSLRDYLYVPPIHPDSVSEIRFEAATKEVIMPRESGQVWMLPSESTLAPIRQLLAVAPFAGYDMLSVLLKDSAPPVSLSAFRLLYSDALVNTLERRGRAPSSVHDLTVPTGSSFRGIVLQNLDLRKTLWYDTDFQQTRFNGAALEGAALYDAVLDGAWISGGANLDSLRVEGGSGRALTMHGASLRGAVLKDFDLTGAAVEAVDLSGALLSGVRLHGAGLDRATLSRAYFYEVDLTGASLEQVNLYDIRGWDRVSSFEGTDLTCARYYDPEAPGSVEDLGRLTQLHEYAIERGALYDAERAEALRHAGVSCPLVERFKPKDAPHSIGESV
ncbi:MAG: pentapeptide repeat-containing protein [Bacteroidota bacterium]